MPARLVYASGPAPERQRAASPGRPTILRPRTVSRADARIRETVLTHLP